MNPNPSTQKSLYSPIVSFEFNYKKNLDNAIYENKKFKILRIESTAASSFSKLALYIDSDLNFISEPEFDKFKRSSIRTPLTHVLVPEELLEKISKFINLFRLKAILKPEYKEIIDPVQEELKAELAKFWH